VAFGHRVSLFAIASHSNGLRRRVTKLNISLWIAIFYRYLQVTAFVRGHIYQLYELVQPGAQKTLLLIFSKHSNTHILLTSPRPLKCHPSKAANPIPPTNMPPTVTKLAGPSIAMPLIPCPDVHPPANLAPNIMMQPPRIAVNLPISTSPLLCSSTAPPIPGPLGAS